MKICKYGISLSRLGTSDIDFVLQKLHDTGYYPFPPEVEELTYDQKLDWFGSINNPKTVYLLVEHDGIKQGLIMLNNINWEDRNCSTQHFYWDDDTANSQLPFICTMILLEIGFYYLNWNTVFTSVKLNDAVSETILKKTGYKPVSNRTTKDEKMYMLSSGELYAGFSSLEKEISHLKTEKTGNGYLLLEPVDYDSGIARVIENNFLESGVYLHRRGISGSRMYFR